MNHNNLIALAGFYEVSVDYLLGQTENRSLPNAPLSELRLSDAMVAVSYTHLVRRVPHGLPDLRRQVLKFYAQSLSLPFRTL